ncbi:hypothetical protein J4207_03730 [Candidatus Woesearchaeota archaeon]|nr:hypothetical protein [Candidatus Woesearchaeota archaeon]HLC80225.1 hypothetical protein [Candidatus Nanoarchaeia archaeon]
MMQATRKEITGKFPIPQAKGPEDITTKFYYGNFWEAVKAAKFYGELASCREVVRTRMDFPTIRDMQRGAWLAEGAVFYPQEKIILVSSKHNPLFNSLKQTEEHFSKQRGLPVEEKTAEEIAVLAEKESSLLPIERNTLVLPWRCYPRGGFGVPFSKAAEDELTVFLFRDLAGEYGFDCSLINTYPTGFDVEFKPCEEVSLSYSGPFALPIFLSKVSTGSHIEVYEKNDFFRNWNFAIDQRKGVYGIPNEAKEKRLRQFGRILSNHGIEDPQVLDEILSKHIQKS